MNPEASKPQKVESSERDNFYTRIKDRIREDLEKPENKDIIKREDFEKFEYCIFDPKTNAYTILKTTEFILVLSDDGYKEIINDRETEISEEKVTKILEHYTIAFGKLAHEADTAITGDMVQNIFGKSKSTD